MKKTLYLAGSEVRVRVDGPSLVVRHGGEAERRYPIGRLRRVVCTRGAGLPWDALQACGDAGLTVAALRRDGNPRGIWMPARAADAGMGALVEEWLDRGGWQAEWSNWCANREMREIGAAAARMRILLRDRRAAVARRVLTDRWGEERKSLAAALKGLLYSHVGMRVVQAGLDPALLAGHPREFDPVKRLTEILHWRHLGDVGQVEDVAGVSGKDAWKRAVALYEKVAGREEQRINALLEAWSGWLGRLWE
mgnify:CR=1 FL=1